MCGVCVVQFVLKDIDQFAALVTTLNRKIEVIIV